MRILQLNHVTLHVRDLAISCSFYEKVLQLEQLPRPAFPSAGAWFRLTDAQQLHLIGGRTLEVHSAIRGNHFALEVDDLPGFKAHLQVLEIELVGQLSRPDGVEQVFFKDPDGHVIEVYGRVPP